MSEPEAGVIDVRTRRRGYRNQNQKERLWLSEGGGFIGVKTKRRGNRCQNQEEV